MAAKKSKRTTKKGKKRPKKASKNNKSYLVRPARFLIRDVFQLWRENKRMMFSFTGLYAAFYFVFVRALTAFDVGAIRDQIQTYFGDSVSEFTGSIILTSAVFGLSIELDEISGLYALLLIVIFSLALLWLLRHIWQGRSTTIKEAFYEGMSPLVPALIIVAIMGLQLIPITIGAFVLATALVNEVAIRWWEIIIVGGISLSTVVLSGYWLSGSFMALYIATIPEMTPMKALRSAKEMLKGRRFIVLQRILSFFLFTGIVAFAFLLLVVMTAEVWALVAVTAISVILLPWMHTFFYTLYRSLLDE